MTKNKKSPEKQRDAINCVSTLKCGCGRTRTCEARRRQIYSLEQLPLCDTPKFSVIKFLNALPPLYDFICISLL